MASSFIPFNSTLLLMGTGVISVGGVGIGSWRILSSEIFRQQEFSLNPSDLNVNESLSSFSFGNYGCVKNFFPKVNISHNKLESDLDNPEEKLSQKPEYANESSNVSGCSLLQMFNDLSVPKWSMKSEVVFKNDKVGWILWASGWGRKEKEYGVDEGTEEESYFQKLEYRVLLLERKNYDWVIKQGYDWEDSSVHGSDLNLHLKIEEEKFIDEQNDDAYPKTGSSSSTKNYFGIWKNDSGGGSILEGIKIGGRQSDFEILGRKNNFSTKYSNDEDEEGFRTMRAGYMSGAWYHFKHKKSVPWKGIDVSSFLDEWYKPFREKQGKWIKKDEYCKTDSNQLHGDLGRLCSL